MKRVFLRRKERNRTKFTQSSIGESRRYDGLAKSLNSPREGSSRRFPLTFI